MKRVIWTLLGLLLVSVSAAPAGVFGKKPPAPTPDRAMSLVNTLKSDTSSSKRASAAEELRNYDANSFPEIVPALIDALQTDSSATVRREAAQSLGRIQPTTSQAEQALKAAEDNDGSTLVRLQARTSLLGYRVAQPAAPATANKKDEMPAQVKTAKDKKAKTDKSEESKPQERVVVTVPPPDADGRIRPVPVPSATTPMPLPAPTEFASPTTKPLPTPEKHEVAKPSEPLPLPKNMTDDPPPLPPPPEAATDTIPLPKLSVARKGKRGVKQAEETPILVKPQ